MPWHSQMISMIQKTTWYVASGLFLFRWEPNSLGHTAFAVDACCVLPADSNATPNYLAPRD